MIVAAIIQARIKSTRLPGKILKDLAGRPMLWHVVERAERARTVDKVIVATTTNLADDEVTKLAEKEGWNLYRGSEDNVLERYYEAAKHYGTTAVVRLGGDSPLADPNVIDRCVETLVKGNWDLVSNCGEDMTTYPRGLDVRVVSYRALERAYREATETYEKEHVLPYIWENKKGVFKIGPVLSAPPEYRRDYRLTVDYPEDLSLMEEIYRRLWRPGTIIEIRDVIKLLDANPKFVEVNAHCAQKPFK